MSEISVTLPADEDGFLSRECPTCLNRFKAAVVEGAVHVNWCPYCGHQGDDCWLTEDQRTYVTAIALRSVLPTIDSAIAGLQRASGGLIRISAERSTPDGPVVPSESGGPDEIVTCPQCDARAKVESRYLTGANGEPVDPTCVACGAVVPRPQR